MRVARVSPEVTKTPLKGKKRNFEGDATNCASATLMGAFSLTRFDQYFNAAFWGEKEKVSSRVPSYQCILGGSNRAFLEFYHHVDHHESSVLSSALNATGGLLKKFGLWGSSTPAEEHEVPIAPGDNMSVRGRLADSNNRVVVDVAAAPYGLSLAAVRQLGRILKREQSQDATCSLRRRKICKL